MKKRTARKVMTALFSLTMLMALSVQAAATEAARMAAEQPQTGDNNGLILVLSAMAITGMIVLIAIHWGKKKFFKD